MFLWVLLRWNWSVCLKCFFECSCAGTEVCAWSVSHHSFTRILLITLPSLAFFSPCTIRLLALSSPLFLQLHSPHHYSFSCTLLTTIPSVALFSPVFLHLHSSHHYYFTCTLLTTIPSVALFSPLLINLHSSHHYSFTCIPLTTIPSLALFSPLFLHLHSSHHYSFTCTLLTTIPSIALFSPLFLHLHSSHHYSLAKRTTWTTSIHLPQRLSNGKASWLLDRDFNDRTRNNGVKLIMERSNTSIAQHFYPIKMTTTRMTYQLSDIVSSRTVNRFKNRSDQHWELNPPNVRTIF